MEVTQLMAVGCFVLAVPQGIEAALKLTERGKKKGANMPPSRTVFAVVMLLVAFLGVGFGVWLLDHPIKPRVVVQTKTIEKIVSIPCPAIKTGPATARAGKGGTAIGHSGSGDTNTITPPPQPK